MEGGEPAPGPGGRQLTTSARRVLAPPFDFKRLRFALLFACQASPALRDAGDRGDAGAEAEANLRVQDMCPRLEEVVMR
jgi:hypothetical protein